MANRGPLRRRAVTFGAGAALVGAFLPRPVPAQDSPPSQREGGIGGTGIIGLVTGLAPLRINGLRLATGPETLYRDVFGPIPPGALRPGDAVTILARHSGTGAPRAMRVERVTPLVGQLAAGPDGLFVNGVRIRPEPGVRPRTPAGSRVAVSGLWDGATVVASRIDDAPPRPEDVIAGGLSRDLLATRIGGVPVEGGGFGLRVPNDGFGVFRGRFDAGRFAVSAVIPGRFRGQGAAGLRALVVEGYLERAAGAPGWRVSALGHSFDAAAQLDPVADARVLFAGPYRETFRVETGLVLPEETGARQRLLAAAELANLIRLR